MKEAEKCGAQSLGGEEGCTPINVLLQKQKNTCHKTQRGGGMQESGDIGCAEDGDLW